MRRAILIPAIIILTMFNGSALYAAPCAVSSLSYDMWLQIKGARYDGPTGQKLKIKCHPVNPTQIARNGPAFEILNPSQLILDPTCNQVGVDYNSGGFDSAPLTGSSVAVPAKPACATDQSLAPAPGATIHYASEMKTTDVTTTVAKKEKGPLVYTLPDGTIFVGTMQLKKP